MVLYLSFSYLSSLLPDECDVVEELPFIDISIFSPPVTPPLLAPEALANGVLGPPRVILKLFIRGR